MKRILIILLAFVLILSSCATLADIGDGERPITDIRIFAGTPAWQLAQAVNRENTRTIARIAQSNPELLDYQDPYYGITPLIWAVGRFRYDSARALLEAGADPDIVGNFQGTNALFIAATGSGWYFFCLSLGQIRSESSKYSLLSHHFTIGSRSKRVNTEDHRNTVATATI